LENWSDRGGRRQEGRRGEEREQRRRKGKRGEGGREACLREEEGKGVKAYGRGRGRRKGK
jgi:hypothetical protein